MQAFDPFWVHFCTWRMSVFLFEDRRGDSEGKKTDPSTVIWRKYSLFQMLSIVEAELKPAMYGSPTGEVFGYLDPTEMATGLQVSWGLAGTCLSLPDVLHGGNPPQETLECLLCNRGNAFLFFYSESPNTSIKDKYSYTGLQQCDWAKTFYRRFLIWKILF